ncbi:MAG: RNA methyltransferase [Hydrogenophaga sp.]|uniref:TrmH family RNA methyltransferase n=1 Tax=Hydrogenophaga sp. TaxID=1904254 RepID=UPI002754A0F1|nr:RNA methyltransferase [Hydrogenophaga sp.]MDP2417290.1 RNA methyltransferase [Hydrogenophaga sp.]MDZ4189704.1 RNA methyltransferase [Hydrogenophaga sp.]
MNAPTSITSRDNPLLKRLRLLAHDTTAYRKQGQVWLEGDHLCRALLARKQRPDMAVFTDAYWLQAPHDLRDAADKIVTIPHALMAGISALESAAGVGFVWNLPAGAGLLPGEPAVVLDRLQDAGNVGSILRSAAAFGFKQVLALKGTAALWSPKVVRAGMGAHFALHLVEGLAVDDLSALAVPLVCTSSHQGDWLHQARLPSPCAWVLGHEGQGVSAELAALASQSVRIAQPGGEESLNVAAAAAICLHASAVAGEGAAR